MKIAYLGLGSNIGNREAHLQKAIQRLQARDLRLRRLSSIYETEPMGLREQPWFLNQVAEFETELHPLQLLTRIRRGENNLGRKRKVVNGPRTIDIDILLHGNTVMETPELKIPHPRYQERRFVLDPLAELEPAFKDPETGQPIATLLGSSPQPERQKTTIGQTRMSIPSKDPVRLSDALLALIFGALIVIADATPDRALLFGLAVLQLIEGRVPLLRTGYGRIASVALQLLISFELMHVTGDVASPYILILLFPVVSTAALLGVVATVIASIAAVFALLAPLLLYDWGTKPGQYYMDTEGWHILAIRGLLLAGTAVLVNMLGTAIRTESARNKETAEKLAIANENLIAAEAAKRRAERLAALGQLTAGLAHELRNPLASIKGSADLLARSSTERDPVARELGEIISSEVDRTNLLVTRFLDFARPLEPRREMADIAQIIDRAAGHSGVAIVRDFASDIPQLAIDPALMEQVFINLLSNAAQASEAGQPVTVITRLAANTLEISVIDHGSGIPPDKIETIFNPFVTTKQTGVGLGLAIVSKIVTGHGGKITVNSEPGKGSTFRITLPVGYPKSDK